MEVTEEIYKKLKAYADDMAWRLQDLVNDEALASWWVRETAEELEQFRKDFPPDQ